MIYIILTTRIEIAAEQILFVVLFEYNFTGALFGGMVQCFEHCFGIYIIYIALIIKTI